MITDWVGGVQKGQNIDYVIYEWSLNCRLPGLPRPKRTLMIAAYWGNCWVEATISVAGPLDCTELTAVAPISR